MFLNPEVLFEGSPASEERSSGSEGSVSVETGFFRAHGGFSSGLDIV